jgi:hypothetical protein
MYSVPNEHLFICVTIAPKIHAAEKNVSLKVGDLAYKMLMQLDRKRLVRG